MDSDNANHGEMPPADMLEELDWQSIRMTVLRAALQLQVWSKVASGPKTAHRIAEENGWDITGAQRLLDALCCMKLLDKQGYEYQLVPVSTCYLVSGTPSYMGDVLLADMAWEGNGKLAEAIRTGRHPIVDNYTSGGIAAYWAGNEASSRLRPEKVIEGKEDIWRRLGVQAREGLRVLDVACGSASTTLALAKQNPGVVLTLHDWPPVVESALVVAEKLGIDRQVKTLTGDIRTVDLGEGQYDLIWIGDFLHFWAPDEIAGILRRLHKALAPRGVLVVKETVVDEARRDTDWLLGSLWLWGVSGDGNLYTPSEWIDFLRQAGFANPVPVSKEDELPRWFKASKQ